MAREDLNDLRAFTVVAAEQNFTRAAAKLGVSQSALSHALRRLEARLNIRLLSRTTRRVMPTLDGERLLRTLGPALDSIAAEIAAIADMRGRTAGTVRISCSEHAARTVLWPVLERLLPDYPEIEIELNMDAGLTDIVGERYDAGVRLGEQLAKDMIAVRIGPDLRMAVVGAPSYLAGRTPPRTPQDLAQHRCINLRLPTRGSLYAWELEKDGRETRVRVEGQLVLNTTAMVLSAAAAGFGLACVIADQVHSFLADGRLVQVLEDWCPPFAGYHLYYPSRRQNSAAFNLVVDALRRAAVVHRASDAGPAAPPSRRNAT